MKIHWTSRATAPVLLAIGAIASLPWTVHDVFLGRIDAGIYLRTAQALVDGHGYQYLEAPFTLRPPGFPVLLTPVIATLGVNFLALNIWVSLFGVLAVVLAFLEFRSRIGDLPALAVALALWVNPIFQANCNAPMSDIPGLALLLVALRLDHWARRTPGHRRQVVLGVAVAAAAYVRTVSVLLLPALLISHLLADRPSRAALRRWATAAITAIVLLAPWTILSMTEAPDSTADRTWLHSQTTAMWHVDKGDPDSAFLTPSQLGERARTQALWIAQSLGDRLRRSDPGAIDGWLGMLAIACLVAVAIRRRGTGDFLALAMIAVLVLWHISYTRLLLPVYLFALPAVVDVVRGAVSRALGAGRSSVAVATAVVLLAFLDARAHTDWKDQQKRHQDHLDDAAALAAALSPDEVVASTYGASQYSVYLSRPVYALGPAYHRDGLEGVRRVLDRFGVDVVILGNSTPRPLYNELTGTFTLQRLRPRLALVRRDLEGRLIEHPNIVLISIDSLRADHVGGYGYPAGTSPAIDAFADRATLFTYALAQAPWTLPSHASLLTSVYPRTHRTDDRLRRLPPDIPTLAATLSEAGYHTHAIVSGPFMAARFGMDRGFDTYDDSLAKVTHHASHRMVTSPQMHERALSFLDNAGAPFFLFLHYWDVHYDYIPPPPLDERFDPDYSGAVTSDRFIANPAIHAGMAKRDLDHVEALYDGEIASVDSFLGALWNELAERGLDANTAVVLTADHGDEFFEHGEKGHQHSLYQELLHVPLLVSVPGLPSGRVRDEPVELIDVMPTLLQLAHVPIPDNVQGRSLVPVLAGGTLPGRLRFAQTTKALKKRDGDWKGSSWSVLHRGRKLIVFADDHFPPEVYDLIHDPAERHDLGAASSPQLFEELERWRDRIPEGPGETADDLDDETREVLESLGYTGD